MWTWEENLEGSNYGELEAFPFLLKKYIRMHYQ